MSFSYITLTRAKMALPNTYDGTDDSTLATLIQAASAWVDKYTNRVLSIQNIPLYDGTTGAFNSNNYDELLNGTGENTIFVNAVPLISITRISTIVQPALFVRNNDQNTGSRALVAVTTTGVTLTYIANAVTVTNNLAFATYTTINTLVAAINAVGNNWTAGVMGGFGTWSSSDLRPTQGAFGARITTAYIWIENYDYGQFVPNMWTGEIYSWQGFPRSHNNIRIQYVAGYATIPDDLQQAIAEIVVATYLQVGINPNLRSESLGGYSYTINDKKTFDNLSILSKQTLQSYKRRPVLAFSQW
jgi:hypothetical protein